MADGSRVDGVGCVKEEDCISVNNDSLLISDLKTMSENDSGTTNVRMSFYVENNSDVNSDKSEEPSVAQRLSASNSVLTDKSKHVEFPSDKDDDIRKKRCTDRYDSSESSDSGVAVLSICGSSSSDITEPGSPYSPASSASSASGSEGAPGEGARPPWPWVPTTTSSPALTTTRVKRPRADKCTNLESLITKKLHKNAAMPAHPEPAANYNNNILVNTEQKKSNTQTSQHCCIQRAEEIISGMTTAKVLTQPPKSSDSLSQISSIPKHVIQKAVPQQPLARTPTLDRSIESKLKDDKVSQLKIQQGKITEYYKSQMKPNNTLKRDYTALITRVAETKGKISANGVTKAASECNENLGNYLSYLSQTFNSKMAMSNLIHHKTTEPVPRVIPLPASQHNQKLTLQKTELEKKPIPALNPILNANIPLSNVTKKTDAIRPVNSLDLQSKTFKEVKTRTVGSKISGKRARTMESKKSVVAKVTKSSQTSPLMNVDKNVDNAFPSSSRTEISVTNKNIGNDLNGVDNITRQITLSAIHDHMRQVLLKSQSSELKNRVNKTKTQQSSNNSSISDRVPSVLSNHTSTNISTANEITTNSNIHLLSNSSNLQSTNSNSLISTTSAPSLHVTNSSSVHASAQSDSSQDCQTSKHLLNPVSSITTSLPSVTVPPATVMLTAIRIPQPNIQQPSIVNSDTSRTTPNHIAISPSKMNGQFVLPMVQNINGALVQIPGLVTKVGQNTVLPLNPQNLIQRTENIVNHQQTTQMYINGTLVKINGPIHPNLPGLIAKQMTASSTTNVSYTVTQKHLTNAVPTVMASKPNFAMNINHPLFVSSPGFILNPMTGVVTAQSNTATTMPVQQQFGGNMVLTTSLNPGVHMNHSINNSLSGSIPISPIKLGDINRVFLTPTRPIIPNDRESMCNTMTSSTPTVARNIDAIVNNDVSQSSNTLPQPPPAIIEKPSASSEASAGTTANSIPIEDCSSLSPVLPKSRDIAIDSTDVTLPVMDHSLLISEETKTSIDSTSDDLNSISNTNSVESPVTDICKEVDDDSSSTIQTTNDNSNSCVKSTLLSTPKTIRFPPKIFDSESRIKTVTRMEIDESKLCRWNGCTQNFDDSYSLLEHLQDCHVNSQAGKETYTCLWEGCRVYNRSSCSRCWLERHVLSHGGTKLFRCIVDGCGQRFNTQLSLQRHVNNHFTDQGSNNTSAKKSIDVVSAGPKLVRRNGKKLRYRRQPWSARIFDFFDAGIMEGLQYRVVRTAAWRNGEAAGCKHSLYSKERSATKITLAATVLAKRLHETEKYYECLVTWTPNNVIQDEWLPEKDFVPVKDIPISSLDASARDILYTGFCSSYREPEIVNNSLNWTSDYIHCHNNAKTDSLVTDTANETSLFVNNHIVKREDKVLVMAERKQLTGAARRKQWRR